MGWQHDIGTANKMIPKANRIPRHSQTTYIPWRWAMLGSCMGLLMALVFFLPAAWLGLIVEQVSGERVVLNEAQGKIWNGSAQLVLSGGKGSRDAMALPGRIYWRLRPSLPLKMKLDVHADCCTQQAFQIFISPHLTGFSANILPSQSQWPASLMSGLGAPFNTIGLQAAMHLNTQVITLSWLKQQFKFEGQAELDIIDASTRLSTAKPIGSYRVNLSGGTIPKINVQTLNGSLQLTGTGEFTGNRWRFRGEATAATGSEAALNNFLDILGKRVGPRSLITLG